MHGQAMGGGAKIRIRFLPCKAMIYGVMEPLKIKIKVDSTALVVTIAED